MAKCGRCRVGIAKCVTQRQFSWVTTFEDGVQPAWFSIYECDNCGKYGKCTDPQIDAPLGVPMRVRH